MRESISLLPLPAWLFLTLILISGGSLEADDDGFCSGATSTFEKEDLVEF